jgi:two-component system, NarL family, sensor histidine kinase LiaS
MKDHPLTPALGGTAAVFLTTVVVSYLISQQGNWLWAATLATFFGLTYGLLTLIRVHNTLRLQWRLTLSYTAVTVAALLIVEMALLGGAFLLVRSNFLIDQMGDALHDMYVLEARQYLLADPPDLEGLTGWMARTFDDSPESEFAVMRRVEGGRSGPWQFSFDQLQPVFVLDEQGRLLAQNQSPPNSAPEERPFDFAAMPGLAERFTAAQQGERALSQLRFTRPDNHLVNLFPLLDDDNRFLGALIITLPLPGLNVATLGPVLIMIAYSIIPLTLAAGLIGAVFGFLTARNLTRRITAVAQAADSWSRGDFTAVALDPSQDELGQLSRRLNRMAEQLQNLLQTRQELATVEERNRLARDLHDAVKQQVFAAAMQIGAARELLPDNPTAAANHLAEAEALARQSQQELATLIQELRPVALNDQGLAAALRHYAADWSRQNNIVVDFRVGGERPLPLTTEQALFRIVQEALANIARHSQATAVDLQLVWSNGEIEMIIGDNGQGFDPAQTPAGGLGIDSMRERAEALGGRFSLESQSGKGTEVRVCLKP